MPQLGSKFVIVSCNINWSFILLSIEIPKRHYFASKKKLYQNLYNIADKYIINLETVVNSL